MIVVAFLSMLAELHLKNFPLFIYEIHLYTKDSRQQHIKQYKTNRKRMEANSYICSVSIIYYGI